MNPSRWFLLLLALSFASIPAVAGAQPSGSAFGGTVWVNAEPADGAVVRALIGGVECATATAITPADGTPTYSLVVPSQQEKAGCGVDGSEITFDVNGMAAHETAVWSGAAPGTFQPLQLTAGGRFAAYSGTIVGARRGDKLEVRTPAGIVCGSSVLLDVAGANAPQPYSVVVKSVDLVPGCPDDNSLISFWLNGSRIGTNVSWLLGFHTLDFVVPASEPSTSLPPTGAGPSAESKVRSSRTVVLIFILFVTGVAVIKHRNVPTDPSSPDYDSAITSIALSRSSGAEYE
ncbi:MAG: hypothetical protein WEB52_07145 [Dehalococcoidia bacterium]